MARNHSKPPGRLNPSSFAAFKDIGAVTSKSRRSNVDTQSNNELGSSCIHENLQSNSTPLSTILLMDLGESLLSISDRDKTTYQKQALHETSVNKKLTGNVSGYPLKHQQNFNVQSNNYSNIYKLRETEYSVDYCGIPEFRDKNLAHNNSKDNFEETKDALDFRGDCKMNRISGNSDIKHSGVMRTDLKVGSVSIPNSFENASCKDEEKNTIRPPSLLIEVDGDLQVLFDQINQRENEPRLPKQVRKLTMPSIFSGEVESKVASPEEKSHKHKNDPAGSSKKTVLKYNTNAKQHSGKLELSNKDMERQSIPAKMSSSVEENCLAANNTDKKRIKKVMFIDEYENTCKTIESSINANFGLNFELHGAEKDESKYVRDQIKSYTSAIDEVPDFESKAFRRIGKVRVPVPFDNAPINKRKEKQNINRRTKEPDDIIVTHKEKEEHVVGSSSPSKLSTTSSTESMENSSPHNVNNLYDFDFSSSSTTVQVKSIDYHNAETVKGNDNMAFSKAEDPTRTRPLVGKLVIPNSFQRADHLQLRQNTTCSIQNSNRSLNNTIHRKSIGELSHSVEVDDRSRTSNNRTNSVHTCYSDSEARRMVPDESENNLKIMRSPVNSEVRSAYNFQETSKGDKQEANNQMSPTDDKKPRKLQIPTAFGGSSQTDSTSANSKGPARIKVPEKFACTNLPKQQAQRNFNRQHVPDSTKTNESLEIKENGSASFSLDTFDFVSHDNEESLGKLQISAEEKQKDEAEVAIPQGTLPSNLSEGMKTQLEQILQGKVAMNSTSDCSSVSSRSPITTPKSEVSFSEGNATDVSKDADSTSNTLCNKATNMENASTEEFPISKARLESVRGSLDLQLKDVFEAKLAGENIQKSIQTSDKNSSDEKEESPSPAEPIIRPALPFAQEMMSRLNGSPDENQLSETISTDKIQEQALITSSSKTHESQEKQQVTEAPPAIKCNDLSSSENASTVGRKIGNLKPPESIKDQNQQQEGQKLPRSPVLRSSKKEEEGSLAFAARTTINQTRALNDANTVPNKEQPEKKSVELTAVGNKNEVNSKSSNTGHKAYDSSNESGENLPTASQNGTKFQSQENSTDVIVPNSNRKQGKLSSSVLNRFQNNSVTNGNAHDPTFLLPNKFKKDEHKQQRWNTNNNTDHAKLFASSNELSKKGGDVENHTGSRGNNVTQNAVDYKSRIAESPQSPSDNNESKPNRNKFIGKVVVPSVFQ